MTLRLARRVVELTRCSRSEADQYVEGGWVLVDGVVVEEPQFEIEETQTVELHPDAQLTPTEPATMLLHRPANHEAGAAALALVEPATRWKEDASGVRTLKRHRTRLEEVLPLEPTASGLVVFTQDRRVSLRIKEEGQRIEHEMIAEVSGTIASRGLALLAHGVVFEGRALAPAKVSWQNETRLRFALKAPRPGQIAHACREVGLELVGLKRIRIGRIPLTKMPPGEWRYLPVHERF